MIPAGRTGNGGEPQVRAEVHLDLKGLKCPLPALRTRKALAMLAPGTELVVTCTDPMSVIDIPHLAHETGDHYAGHEIDSGIIIFRLRRKGG